jgi:hypothetical protein
VTAKELQAVIQPAINGIHSVSATVGGHDVEKTPLCLVLPDPFEVRCRRKISSAISFRTCSITLPSCQYL